LLEIPPLRQRPEDLLPLARHFVERASDGSRRLTPEAEKALLEYAWPGNVRELRSVLEQAVLFAAGTEIEARELNLSQANWLTLERQSRQGRTLAEVERRHILDVLKQTEGNKAETARILGISRSTLILKLKEFGE